MLHRAAALGPAAGTSAAPSPSAPRDATGHTAGPYNAANHTEADPAGPRTPHHTQHTSILAELALASAALAEVGGLAASRNLRLPCSVLHMRAWVRFAPWGTGSRGGPGSLPACAITATVGEAGRSSLARRRTLFSMFGRPGTLGSVSRAAYDAVLERLLVQTTVRSSGTQ